MKATGWVKVNPMERKLTTEEDREIRRILALLGERAAPADLAGELGIFDTRAYILSLRRRLDVKL